MQAEQKKQVGQFAIHYMALRSTFLSQEIAKHYKISRGVYTGIVNISILDTSKIQNPHSCPDHRVRKQSKTTAKPLAFKEIKDNGAIYYLAEFTHENAEILKFHLKINAQDKLNTDLDFEQTFYLH